MPETSSPSTESERGSDPRNRIAVVISADRMAAWITIAPPTEDEGLITSEEVLAQLSAARVTFGLDLAAVEAAIASARRGELPDTPVLIAQGQPPIPGEDGTITYHPALSSEARRPRLLPDGTVDMFDLNTVRNVATGAVLATVTMPTKGVDGTTVIGTRIPAAPGRPASFTAGRGTTFDPDHKVVTASLDGHAGLTLNEITVTDQYHILGDLGLATGNIDFVGSVRITGNVQPGYSLRTQGDVEVLGSVEGATVEAKGNVTVHGGIVGGRRGTRIRAQGFVKARFIESAEVCAGGSVWAKDGILHSRISAGDAVEVLGRRGVIVGGNILARNRICAHSLGSQLGTLTELTVGPPAELHTERAELRNRVKQLTTQLEQADQLLQNATERIQRGDNSASSHARLAKAASLENEVLKALTLAQSREKELDQQLLEGRLVFVQATERCFPGVRHCLSGVRQEVASELGVSHFILDDLHQVAVVPGVRAARRA